MFKQTDSNKKRTNKNFAKPKIKTEQSAHLGIQTWPFASASGGINSSSPNIVNSQKFTLHVG